MFVTLRIFCLNLFEALLKVAYATEGSVEQLARTLTGVRMQLLDSVPSLHERVDEWLVDGFALPERIHTAALILELLNRLLLGARFRDANCGFRLMRRALVEDLLPRVHLLPQFINTELLLRAWAAGYRVEEVPVRHYARSEGGSRGLPPARIPGEVARLVRGLFALKGELAAAQTSERPAESR